MDAMTPQSKAAAGCSGCSPASDESRAEIEARILDAVRSLQFGTVEVTVHASQVVQIERREKLRFDPSPKNQRAPKHRAHRPEPAAAG